jgi:hypothetical protein
MSKTLSESAAEILRASMNAGKEPMQTLATQMDDLGGTTNEKPEGDEVGKKAAAATKEAPKPGQVSAEGDKKMNSVKSSGLATPVVGNMDPSLGEETEETEEEETILEDSEEEETLLPEAKSEDDEDEEEEEEEEDEEEMKMKMKKEMVEKYRGSMREDVDALFNGESLSEDFRVKATTIFEAAVQSRVESIVEDVLSENDAVLIEAIEEIKNEMSAQVDEYLSYAVEEWVNENQVAIETGLRAELVEDFINGLKNLFTEHYIEIPEEKVDVAEELAMTVAQLEEAMTAAAAEKADLVEKLNVANKNEAIRKICEGLTEVQVGKMKSLAEGMEFTTEGDFNNKLAVIRENYFPSKKMTSEVKVLQETAVEEPEVVEASGMMKHYVNAITKTAPKA